MKPSGSGPAFIVTRWSKSASTNCCATWGWRFTSGPQANCSLVIAVIQRTERILVTKAEPATVAAAGLGALVVALGGPPAEIRPQRDALRRLGVPVLTSPASLTTAVRALTEQATVLREQVNEFLTGVRAA